MAARKKTTRSTNNRKKNNSNQIITTFKEELITWIVLAVSVLLCLCNFHICGALGNAVSNILFGMFGLLAYVIPILVFIGFIFKLANKDLGVATIKLIAGIVLICLLGILIDLILGGARKLDSYDIKAIYEAGIERKSGGFIFGSLAFLIHHFIGTAGTVLASIVLAAICVVIITERSLFQTGRSLMHNVQESAWDNTEKRRERTRIKRQEDDERHRARMEQKRLDDERWQQEELRRQQEEDEKILRMDKKTSGVDLGAVSSIKAPEASTQDIISKEIDVNESERSYVSESIESVNPYKNEAVASKDIVKPIRNIGEAMHEINALDFEDESMYENIRIHSKRSDEFFTNISVPETDISFENQVEYNAENNEAEIEASSVSDEMTEISTEYGENITEVSVEDNSYKQEDNGQMTFVETAEAVESRKKPKARLNNGSATFSDLDNYKPPVKKNKPYKLPPINLLKGSGGANGKSNESELERTSIILEETLKNFGVEAKVIGASRGPSVTRYEIQPKAGVKVSRIVNLQDDIKLNLAATDIRIEAPIPGKSAVGIEVPNESSEMVSLRELIESPEFKAEKEDKSKLSFAVGKDIAGKTIVTNIGKMPHGLIAGSTGSGKSVCINTMILSLLYKFSPDELKLIMVDPKVVELSVYNGIPHLMIPVVTDPKKAAAALSWAVSEMTDRYKKFADMSVRDLAGYNRKVEGLTSEVDMAVYKKLPYIVIIVDEMADLMMVAAKEVEDSISRLAALARACGIHLILATQRPSVDVITGVIKANMPSRVAFAVSSTVDSRTILDMAGAEKLLGKGDMLFFPQGFPKPVRLQGAFVSDSEVEDVVNFIKVQQFKPEGQEEVEEKINSISVSSGGGTNSGSSAGDDGSEYDDLFVDAGKYIIENDRATVGNLQRKFKIGFNRAARIMDQLCESGVVGEGEGTKPRKVLMSMTEFEAFIEECL